MLVLEIALGIVLGVLLLAYLRQIVVLIVIGAVVALFGALAIIGWQQAKPFHDDIEQVFGLLLVVAFVIAGGVFMVQVTRNVYREIRWFVSGFMADLRGTPRDEDREAGSPR